MLELAGLSFLGFGAKAPTPEWGFMLNEGREVISNAPWMMIFPGAAIFTAEQGELEAGMRVMVHPRLPSEQRQVVLKNRSGRKLSARLLFYFERNLRF